MQSFIEYLGKPISHATYADLQGWADTLTGLALSTQRSRIATIKSLLSFGCKLGILTVNVAAPLTAPKAPDTLNERLLLEYEVANIIAKEPNTRNRLILKLLYVAALRVSELCALKWKHLNPRGETGQVTVFGKGGVTRSVLLPPQLWAELPRLRGGADANDAVFCSREGDGHLDRTWVYRIIREAASRVKLAPTGYATPMLATLSIVMLLST